MSWCDESGEHEGYVALLFADGEVGSGATGAGVLVWPGGDIAKEELRSYSQVVAWQVRCECGWHGDELPIALEQDSDIDARWMEPTEAREEELRQVWWAHAAPFNALHQLADLTRQARAIDAQIMHTVQCARAAGASWAQIARRVGVTTQAAHQRYAHRVESTRA